MFHHLTHTSAGEKKNVTFPSNDSALPRRPDKSKSVGGLFLILGRPVADKEVGCKNTVCYLTGCGLVSLNLVCVMTPSRGIGGQSDVATPL